MTDARFEDGGERPVNLGAEDAEDLKVISALTQREHLTEMVELPQSVHPWYVGVQFHPEFKSTPWDGHPLFNAYIRAALDLKGSQKLKAVA